MRSHYDDEEFNLDFHVVFCSSEPNTLIALKVRILDFKYKSNPKKEIHYILISTSKYRDIMLDLKSMLKSTAKVKIREEKHP